MNALVVERRTVRAVGDVRKAHITDAELCAAVFKQRLKDNQQRAIVLAEGGEQWFYVYLFAKSNCSNIGGVGLKIHVRKYKRIPMKSRLICSGRCGFGNANPKLLGHWLGLRLKSV